MTKEDYIEELSNAINELKSKIAENEKIIETSAKSVEVFDKEETKYMCLSIKASINELYLANEFLKRIIKDKERLLSEIWKI